MEKEFWIKKGVPWAASPKYYGTSGAAWSWIFISYCDCISWGHLWSVPFLRKTSIKNYLLRSITSSNLVMEITITHLLTPMSCAASLSPRTDPCTNAYSILLFASSSKPFCFGQSRSPPLLPPRNRFETGIALAPVCEIAIRCFCTDLVISGFWGRGWTGRCWNCPLSPWSKPCFFCESDWFKKVPCWVMTTSYPEV